MSRRFECFDPRTSVFGARHFRGQELPSPAGKRDKKSLSAEEIEKILELYVRKTEKSDPSPGKEAMMVMKALGR
jgi:hypothetical protein